MGTPDEQASTTVRQELWEGVRSMAPFLLSAIPLGIVGGVLGLTSGLSAWSTLGLAMAVNSGTAQFVGIALIADGAGWPTIILTTLILGLRMLIYSTILTPHVRDVPHRWRVLLGFGLIDVIFFVGLEKLKNGTITRRKHLYFIGASAAMYTTWMASTVVGTTLGSAIPDLAGLGLDFPMTAMFVAMLAASLANWRVIAVVVTAGLTVLLARGLPYNLGVVLAAVVGAAVGTACERIEQRLRRTSEEVEG
ncbi:AzlC family ABC transporter permease [Actinosynnema sp. CS-041913]|uniref:AzlC family ABC transporter permease n=1 Tax=Actinosynnema sp. CS-041913 TaxID=3239917 RepID=UPI003D8E27FD